MPEVPRVGDLQVAQDLPFERRMQTVERVGWAVIGLVLLAALLGLFGTGLFSQTSVGDPSGPLWMEYDRFLRYPAPQQLRIRIGPDAVREGKARLWLSDDYLEGVRIKQIDPRPEVVELGPGGQTFAFAAADLSGPAAVVFYLEPERVGSLSGRVGLPGGPTFAFNQFVYP